MLDSALDVYTTSTKDILPSKARQIGRVFVGSFWEAPILNLEMVYVDIYKIVDGFILCCDWDWTCIQVTTPHEAQEIIEQLQDTWTFLAQQFNMD